jgi:cholesterol transport system auxiliary component
MGADGTRWARIATDGLPRRLVLLLPIALGGCALANLGQPAAAPATYDLLTPHIAQLGARTGVQMIVSEPAAVRALAGDGILVRPKPQSVTYFADAAWSDQLPRLVQARLIQALNDSGRFRAVGSALDRLAGDLEMMTEIREFGIDASQAPPVARVDLFVRIADQASGRLVSSKAFVAAVDAEGREPAQGVAALNAALQQVLAQIVPWAGGIGARVSADVPAADKAPPA